MCVVGITHAKEPSQIPRRLDGCCRNCQVRAAVSLMFRDIKNAGDPSGHQKNALCNNPLSYFL